jgi:hypothetical protein
MLKEFQTAKRNIVRIGYSRGDDLGKFASRHEIVSIAFSAGGLTSFTDRVCFVALDPANSDVMV